MLNFVYVTMRKLNNTILVLIEIVFGVHRIELLYGGRSHHNIILKRVVINIAN